MGCIAQHIAGTQADVFLRVQGQVHPGHHGAAAFTPQQAFPGVMQGDHRRGTHGVQCHAGAAQVVDMGNAIGDRTVGGNRHQRLTEHVTLERVVLLVHRADKHPQPRLIALDNTLAGQAGAVEQVLHGLQQEARRRVDDRRFSRRDIEERRVECRHPVDKAAPLARAFAQGRLRCIKRLGIPTLRRDLPDTVITLGQAFPERFNRIGTGIAPGHCHNGNQRFLASTCQRFR
ncbi:hypothetical protein D3C84_540790 [compost metagenome]